MDNTVSNAASTASGNSTCTTSTWKQWGDPQHLFTNVFEDRIEIAYKADSCVTFTVDGFSGRPSLRVWKEVYKAVDGKIQLVETIEGSYHSPQGEFYSFDK